MDGLQWEPDNQYFKKQLTPSINHEQVASAHQ